MRHRNLSSKSETMKFEELEKRMRIFETSHDHCVQFGLFMVARIDGLNFTRLTREIHHFDAPFGVRMRDYMVENSTLAGEASAKFSVLLGDAAAFDCRISQLP